MKDWNVYNLRMNAALQEKLFFLKHIDINKYDLIVDFGCATGELLRAIQTHVRGETRLMGYDVSERMIEAANMQNNSKIIFTEQWDRIDMARRQSARSLIIFSSVLHEVGEKEQSQLIDTVMPLFTTIVVRDMKRPLNNEPISNTTRKRILKQVAPWQGEMFESRWGRIEDKYGLYRFFLMNEFVENFENEVEEDYFSVEWSNITWTLEMTHDEILCRGYTLPYRKEQVKKRFNHVMQDVTHLLLIFTKKTPKNV